ncbi:MAG: EamA family transporter, partial [Acidobacteria bacterium]
MADRRASLRGDLALLCCAALWGATFPATRALLQHASPLTANALRFTAAALLLAPAGLRGRSSPARLPGIALGLVLGAGYALQTAGLARIGSARSAFLTALYVLMTPLVEWALRRGRPPLRTLAGGALAVAGVAVMSGPAAW